ATTREGDILRADGWTDASLAALSQGPVRMQVASASVGVVPFLGARPTFSKEKYLIVRLAIQHNGSGFPIDYAHGGAPGSAKLEAPTLTDERGAWLRVAVFGATEIPVGRSARTQVHPGRFAEDVLVFAVPEDGAGALRLRLPAAAWNGAGEMKFLIP